MAIGIVIDHAAGGTHQKDAGGEDHHQLAIRMAGAGNPERPERRPEQQKGADRPIHAHQPGINSQSIMQLPHGC